MGRPTMYWSVVRERAVGMVSEHRGEYPSELSGGDLFDRGEARVVVETLRKWVRRAETDQGVRAGLTTDRLLDFQGPNVDRY